MALTLNRGLLASVFSLMSGSALMSIVSLLAIPILARIYGPDILGVGSVYIALHTFLLVVLTGRYSLALPMVKVRKTAIYIVLITFFLAVFNGALISAIGYIFKSKLSEALSMPTLQTWLPYLGLTVGMAALFETYNYWLVREAAFKKKAFISIIQVAVLMAIQLLFAILGERSIDNYMLSLVIAISASISIILFANLFTAYGVVRNFPKIQFSRLLKIASIFKRLPQHLLTTSFLNTGSLTAVPLIISSYFGPALVATYAVSVQLIGKPLSVISSSIWQVFYGTLGRTSKNVTESSLLLKQVYRLCIMIFSLPVLLIFALPELITAYIGKGWQDIIIVMQAYVVMAYFQYASNSISYFQSFEKYKEESLVNVILVAARAIALLTAVYFNFSGVLTIWIFCLVSSAVYLCVTCYWSQVFGLGWSLPVRGAIIFVTVLMFSLLLQCAQIQFSYRLVLVLAVPMMLLYFYKPKLTQLGLNVTNQQKN